MKKQSVMQTPKEHLGMLQIQVLFYRVLQTGRQSGVIGGFEAFGAVAMAISEGSFREDNSGTRQPERERPYRPPPPPPPKRGDNIRMPYGDVFKNQMLLGNIFK